MWKRGYLVGLVVGLAACSSAPDDALTKAQVAQALGEGQDLGPVCAEQQWYGDGECDSWCPEPDPDCGGTSVACAEFIEAPNGVCSRPEDDPCRFQDPDCDVVACPALYMIPDGICSLPPEDPCQFIDSDCVGCAEIIQSPDGVCSLPADDPCLFQDPDCEVIACPAIYMEPDGICSLPADDPCQFIDSDCVEDGEWYCTMIYEYPDGVCSRPESDPCRFQDPDCDV
jgi:hypothetical protein